LVIILENFETINRRPFYKQHWVLPILLAILLLPILILLPWRTQKLEFEDRQEQLIADTLWVEQGIRSQLIKDEDYIRYLGDDIVARRLSTDQIKNRIATLLQNHPEFQKLVWLNQENQIVYSTSPIAFNEFPPDTRQAIGEARSSNLPQYSQPNAFNGDPSVMLMDYNLPLFDNQTYQGCIVASYRLSSILEKVVPWWFAKDNEISIVDIDDRIVAMRADGGAGHNVFTHSKSLDLPGVNLMLKTNSVKNAPKLMSNLLVLTVVILGIGLSWSLWALWRDILRRQAAEMALQAQIVFRKAMENSLVTGLRVRSMDGRLVYVNSAFCDMVGYTEQQLLGQKIPFSFWTLEAYETISVVTPVKGTINPVNGFETMYQHSSGRRVPVLVYESALLDENGIQTGWMGSILDISERKRTEQILRQHEDKLQRSARLSTMGELASVMAHELNQPLTAIHTYASGILSMIKNRKSQPDKGDSRLEEDLEPALAQMQKQALRAGQIIRSVHDFVVKREPTRTQIPCREIFKNVMPLIEMQAKSYLVNLKTKIEDPLPDVMVDPISLEQVILNLTRNALQAMQDLTQQKREIRIEAYQNGAIIQVDIIDNGIGIAEDVAERLFSPFFSTKSEGMGMGLNICRTIIEFHGGQLTHRPNPTGGTIFSFTIPVIVVPVTEKFLAG